MRVQIAARHCEIPESLRERAETLAGRLGKFDPRVSAAEIVFEEEKLTRRVEVILSVDRRDPVVARGEADEFRTALDKVIDRASRMLRRQRDQATQHKGHGVTKGVTAD